MGRLVRLVLALAVLGCGSGPQPGAPSAGVVAQVMDGDTVILAEGQKVRLLGIDAPEMAKEGRPAEFMAHRARQELADLIQGQTVRLEYDRLRYDQYGRLLAYLYLPEVGMVNMEMVRRGVARVYLTPPNLGARQELVAAQREAMQERRGLWRQELRQDEEYYWANGATYRFHRPSCQLAQKISAAHRLRLASLWAAYSEGFSPCRSCRPHEFRGKD